MSSSAVASILPLKYSRFGNRSRCSNANGHALRSPALIVSSGPLYGTSGRDGPMYGNRETGDGGRTASSGLSSVLALAIPTARRATQGQPRTSESYLHHGGREFRLGCTEDSWGTSEARVGDLRAHCGQISATLAAPRRSRQALVFFPRQSSRGNRRH